MIDLAQRSEPRSRMSRRINELCGVPCTVLGRQVFFAEQHRRDCAGRWQVRSVRLSVKVPNLMTRSYVPKGADRGGAAGAECPRPKACREGIRAVRAGISVMLTNDLDGLN